MKPSFWQVARRPRWVAGLVLAAIVAVIFSLLMQWQLERTFNPVGVSVDQLEPVPISELTGPGYLEPFSFDRLVTAEAELDSDNAYVVAQRLQLVDGEPVEGYWVVANSFVEGASLTLALGFTQDLATAKAAAANLEPVTANIVGYVQPTEAVKPRVDGVLTSVVLGQLVNLYFSEPTPSHPVYLILESGIDIGLEPISIGIRQQEIEINWLTAFYALEWAFFALAAFYVWWRLVQDARVREAEQAAEQSDEPAK
jgi:surfeit locus 1 family protein